MKEYYNLTRITNGWMLNRPNLNSEEKMHYANNVEEYHSTLESALKAIRSINAGIVFNPRA